MTSTTTTTTGGRRHLRVVNGPASTSRPALFEDLPSTAEPAAAFQRRSTEQGSLFKADATTPTGSEFCGF